MKKTIYGLIILAIAGLGVYLLYSTNPCKDKEKCYWENIQAGIDMEGTEDFNKAIEHYLLATKYDKRSYVPYSNLGSAYRALKDFSKAEEYFKKALDLEPNNPSVFTKMYDLYRYDLKKPPHEMMPFFQEAIAKTNNDFNIIKLYAFYLEDINDLETALIVWKSILELDPENQLHKDKVEKLEQKIYQSPL